MLLVRTRVAPSAVHGIGLFAADPIAAGMAVRRFTPGFEVGLSPDLVNGLPETQRSPMLHYGYIDARLHRLSCVATITGL